MKTSKLTYASSTGKTYAYDKYDFHVRPTPRDASVIFCAKEMMEGHYDAKLANSVFLGILCHYWITGEKIEFEKPVSGYTVEQLKSL